jgi:hypothetical protein
MRTGLKQILQKFQPAPPKPEKGTWRDDRTLQVGDLTFTLTTWDFDKFTSSGKNFVLLKDRKFVEQYAELFAAEPMERVLEFGVYHGATLLLLERYFGARRLVGIDLRPPEKPLLDYLAGAGLSDRISAHFGVSQADGPKVRDIIARDFGGRPIDIIIDDASHDLALTRASFEIAFPHLRAGGLYIIEDWGWAHWDGVWQKELWTEKPALSNLVFELIMACTSRRDVIARVDVSPYFVAVRKGETAVDPNSFELSALYLTRGKQLNLL